MAAPLHHTKVTKPQSLAHHHRIMRGTPVLAHQPVTVFQQKGFDVTVVLLYFLTRQPSVSGIWLQLRAESPAFLRNLISNVRKDTRSIVVQTSRHMAQDLLATWIKVTRLRVLTVHTDRVLLSQNLK